MADIKHLIHIERPADAIFPLVSLGNRFAQWWAEDVFDDTGTFVSLGSFGRTMSRRPSQRSAHPHEFLFC